MSEAAGQILRGDDVKFEGKFHLDVVQAGSSLQQKKIPSVGAQQVRIVQNNPDFAVIEMICSCGAKTLLKCEYAGLEAASAASELVPVESEIENPQQ